MLMKILKSINEAPIWKFVFDAALFITLWSLVGLKVATVVAVILLFLILNSKPGE